MFPAVLAVSFLMRSPLAQADTADSDVRPKSGDTTVLGQQAKALKPGEWVELKTDGPGKLISAPEPSKKLDIMTWCDDGHWDNGTKQFVFMGLRQTRRFIAYSEKTNEWRDIGLPEDHEAAGSPPRTSQYGHVYSRNALDAETSRFYHMDHNDGGGIYRYDLVKETWTKLPAGGDYKMTGVIEYFAARGGLVNLGSGKNGVRYFDTKKQAWEKLGPVDVHGHHSLGRHNPFREEVLLAGGNESPRIVVLLKKDGTMKRMKDAPFDLTVRHTIITVDPVSGRYLFMDPTQKKLYEFDAEANTYHLVDDFTKTPWPFARYDAPVAAFIAEHGVTMWVARKTYLYKHTMGR